MKHFSFSFFDISFHQATLVATIATCITIFASSTIFKLLFPIIILIFFGYSALKKNKSVSNIACIAIIFYCLATIRIYQQQQAFKQYQTFLSQPVDIEGTISQINKSTLVKDQVTLLVKISKIKKRIDKDPLSTPLTISLFTSNTQAKFLHEGQFIKVFNIVLQQPEKNPEYVRYLVKENIWATAHCNHQKIYGYKQNNKKFFYSLRKRILQKLSDQTRSLFEPLFLGKKYKSKKSLEIQHHCTQWGISHHMARSGAHLTILFGLLILLLHALQTPYHIRYILCFLTLISYACISYSSISFLRALTMILLIISTKFLNKVSSTLHIFMLTTLVIALSNPAQLFFLDFQLSFGVTLIIIWLFKAKRSPTVAFCKKDSVRS